MKGFAPPSRFGGAVVPAEPLPITRTITVTEGISVKDLAEKLGVRGKDLIASLLMRGVFVTVNQSLDVELVKDVAHQFGADTEFITFEDQMANEAIENVLAQENPDEHEVTRPRWSQSWATSTTVRLRCSMRSARRMWRAEKPGALRSTSARTR